MKHLPPSSERNPMVLRGSPYDDDASDRVARVDIPALARALEILGETFSVAEARSRPEIRPLSVDERRRIIDQSILVLNELYVHRDLKRTKHAVDPVTALRRLKRRSDALNGFDFHLEIMKVFKGLRDIHTAYTMPRPYSDMVAFLPFLLGAYTRPDQRLARAGSQDMSHEDHFDPASERTVIVTGLIARFRHRYFKPGVEILSWNGMPIHKAILLIGEEEQGSNIHAQYELGLRLMTVRWLGGSLPPTEYFVTVAYRDEAGKIREIRFPWRVMLDAESTGRVASVQAMWTLKKKYENTTNEDPSMEHRSLFESTVRDQLFSVPGEIAPEKRVIKIPAEIDGLPPGVFTVHKVKVNHGPQGWKFGLVKIENFVCSRGKFVEGFLKILAEIPQTGLVIDIRSNPGGLVSAAESILQLLTPRPITPLPFQFLATTLVEDIVRSQKSVALRKLDGWHPRVTPAVDMGNQYSRFGTLTQPAQANDTGQRYYGPVALITNAVTYSSGDIFAAGFQDHEIGPVIGVAPTTGGGGANMWTHRDCVDMAEDGRELEFLPGGARNGPKLHYAVRRCTRVGQNQGMSIEEDGVKRDLIHHVTRDDLLGGDVDLLRFTAGVLHRRAHRVYDLTLTVDGAKMPLDRSILTLPRRGPMAEIVIEVDVGKTDDPVEHILSVNDRPHASMGALGGSARIDARLETAHDAVLRLESHDVDRLTGRSRPVFAAFMRRIVFVDPPEPAGPDATP